MSSRCHRETASDSCPGSRRRSLWAAVLLIVAVGPPALAQPTSGSGGGFVLDARRAVVAPEIDGEIESGEWQAASRGEDFIQFEPNRGDPAELQTVVFVLYDDEHLYVAFEAHDPESLMAQMTRRDAELWLDDSVQIYIDTFHDGRSGYFFMTNVLGTQLDGRLADDGNSNDQTWDAAWRSETERTDYGYSVEVSIPLNALQYRAGENTTWGINFARSRRRSLERSYWSGPVDHWVGCRRRATSLVWMYQRRRDAIKSFRTRYPKCRRITPSLGPLVSTCGMP